MLSSKKGIASYLDKLFWKQEDSLKESTKIKKQNLILLKEKDSMRKKIAALEHEIKSISSEGHVLSHPDVNLSLKDNMINCINMLVSLFFTRYGTKRIGKEIADAVWSLDCCSGNV